MAASTVSIIPVLLVYISAQKYFVQGITLTGIK
jgi:ABC-type glycerol-3-phosphate transport system permease component